MCFLFIKFVLYLVQVLRQMRKLPWHDLEVKVYVICCMINIWNVKYNSIHCVANLLAGLVLYQEDVGIHVVDGVLEDIRLGMEVKYFQCFKSPIKHFKDTLKFVTFFKFSKDFCAGC